ncbi:putative Gamma-tubulin complex component GCP6 [Taphrina deformans PYCC 5710]|uniref:Spindle pole body component n=1 Tax=Taphrina deformans (strain PYCC 5710 / ATCC 11124 / CBS 356.35 / IMI 108563 / JCM 9778 / NBRC 8474) TaxID=1097556 RepID=R4XF25_TAPDE|nr:putative Gamma-tubulin complex component GCP6 [Taphrina deformans PYCC 5710]|eukprot:CCG81962.1 putative Gamma-tubulin complex component GCP6 [Taphrina deformans PYCC 5710]
MEELVKPWRDQYRATDPTSFASTLQVIPALPTVASAPHIEALDRRRPLDGIPQLRHGSDKLRIKYDKHGRTRVASACTLAEIPSLEAPKQFTAQSTSSWCYAEVFDVPDMTTFSRVPRREIPHDSDTDMSIPATTDDYGQQYSQAHLYRCLYHLIRGSESPMFMWDSVQNLFILRAQSASVENISSETLAPLLSNCQDYGTRLKWLVLVKDHLFDNATQYTAVHTALGVFLRQFLQYCIDQASHDTADGNVRFVGLMQCLDRVQVSLNWLTNILRLKSGRSISECLNHLSTISLMNDVEKEVRLQTSLHSTHDKVARELLLCLTVPLMQDLSCRIRVSMAPSLKSGLLQASSNDTYTELKYEESTRPNMVAASCAEQILEVHKGILFLRDHARPGILQVIQIKQISPLALTLQLSDLTSCSHEISLRIDDSNLASETPKALVFMNDVSLSTPMSKEEVRIDLEQKMFVSSRPLPITSDEAAKFSAALQAHSTEGGSFDLDYALQVCLLEPLKKQALLVHEQVLYVMLHDMKLREHLGLLHQVFLLQNGLFTSKLREALFRGDGSSINLNHLSKKTDRWPPRSAKVSIATRSLLGNTIGEEFVLKTGHTVVEKEFLGHLGLHLKLEDDDKPVSRSSLEALSFLTFAFRPPKPVDLIITPRAIQLYSRINQFLLVLIRMIDVVERLTLDNREYRTMRRWSPVAETFRIEATNFIHSFAAHIFETVITVKCQQFIRLLDHKGISIETLRDAHLSMLEQICNSALLGSKMKEIQGILRTAFQAVLAFSQIPVEQREHDEVEVPKLYFSFNTNARKLVAVLAGAEATKDASFATGISARFQMNAFWTS